MLPPPGQIPPWRSQISMLDPFNTITEQIKRTKSLMSERERFHHRRSTRHPKLDSLVTVTLENYLSFGLGTGLLGGTITRLGCANGVGKGLSFKPCPNAGAISCLTCNLVKYCSDECQRQHWSRHRSSCLSPFLDPHWLPSWITEGRKPTFLARRRHSYQHTTTWDDGVPAYDCLKLVINEGFDPDRDYKLCFSASGDIRHLIKTVNSLPKVYRGQCDILLNDVDSFVSNRNLVILKVLLSPGPTLDEVAEAVLHLMYSAALTESIYAYAQKCIRALYDDGICHEGDILFRRSFKTRGLGRLSTMQVASGIKKLKGVFTSQKYCLANATAERQAVVLNPMEEDDRQRRLVDMKPHQRPAVQRFWERGILVPYGVDTHHFVHPNPLLFSSEGDWLGGTDLTILQSWDVSDVIQVDSKYNVPASDIFGCFFFYIKHQLKEFARRVKEFNLNIHITQFDSRVLAKGLSAGVLGSFNGPVFDRVDLGALMDIESIGLKGALG